MKKFDFEEFKAQIIFLIICFVFFAIIFFSIILKKVMN